jgi:hypothetical protein
MPSKVKRFELKAAPKHSGRVHEDGGRFGAGYLDGVIVAKAMKLESHGVTFDAQTLDGIIALGNAAADGIKARADHPSRPFADDVGKYLGRLDNFRRDGDVVRADLHFAQVADSSPKGKLRSYVADLAKEDPAAFGMSVVIAGTLDESTDKDFPAVRVSALDAVDVVDWPATQAAMFSTPPAPADPILAERGRIAAILAEAAKHPELGTVLSELRDQAIEGGQSAEAFATTVGLVMKGYAMQRAAVPGVDPISGGGERGPTFETRPGVPAGHEQAVHYAREHGCTISEAKYILSKQAAG